MKIDKAVKKETLFLGCMTAAMTVLMFAVFLIFKKFDLSVLFGGLVGAAVSVLNFFFMCLTLQKSMTYEEEKNRNSFLKMSMSVRMLLMFLVLVVAVITFKANLYATLIPLIFPRLSMLTRQAKQRKEAEESENDETEKPDN